VRDGDVAKGDDGIIAGSRNGAAGPHRRVVPVAADAAGPRDRRQQGPVFEPAQRRPEASSAMHALTRAGNERGNRGPWWAAGRPAHGASPGLKAQFKNQTGKSASPARRPSARASRAPLLKKAVIDKVGRRLQIVEPRCRLRFARAGLGGEPPVHGVNPLAPSPPSVAHDMRWTCEGIPQTSGSTNTCLSLLPVGLSL